MKTGIYGGTFNPPHKGHIQAAYTALNALGLDRLLVFPAGDPPHKFLPGNTPDPDARLEMTKLAFSHLKGVEVCDDEIKRTGVSYTSDTLRAVREKYPNDELFLIMGTDMLESLHHWHEADMIVHIAQPCVLMRSEEDSLRISSAAAELKAQFGTDVKIIGGNVIDISSSELRDMLRLRRGREYLSESVYGFIIKQRLYDIRIDFDWLRTKAYKWLKAERIPHVAGCEAEAVSLARRWGENEDDAREAAILHDITKKYKLEEQLNLCVKYDIIIDEIEKKEYKLLHSKTGAAAARAEYGISDRVFDSIYWHTTGKEDMSLLEKIIYMADYIEPTRDFDGLEELRRLAYENIDDALELGLRMSIDDMKSRGIIPHERSLMAAEWLAHKRGTK